MCSMSWTVPLTRAAGMAAARSMLFDRAVKPAVAPAICRKRRRLSSGMGVGPLGCVGTEANRVFQEDPPKGKG